MYLMISNEGTVSRKYFELLGATDKRERMDDFSVIGNKGSGAKLAIIPTLRLGLEVIISSQDSLGTYALRYKTQEVDLGKGRTVRQIIFSYDGEGDFPSQLTLDAFQDWDRPVGDDDKRIFKALREYICNAWDEDKNFRIERTTEVIPAPKGSTVVYLTLSQEIEEILQNIPQYLKILSEEEPLYADERLGAIYPKSDSTRTRLFSQGVLVDCKESSWNACCLFDYSLFSKHLLSEERVIKDFSRYESQLGKLIISVADIDLAYKILKGWIEREARIEERALAREKDCMSSSKRAVFKEAWKNLFGPLAILGVGITQVDEDARYKGYEVISWLDYDLKLFLVDCGVTQASDVVPKQQKQGEEKRYEQIEPTSEQQSRFEMAYKIFRKHVPKVEDYPVFFFRPLDFSFADVQGFPGEGKREYREIWINESALGSVREILKVLEHEERHCEKKLGDYNRDFEQAAGERFVDLMLANPNPERGGSFWGIVSSRGIQLPQKLVGKSVHILVEGDEVRIRIREETPMVFTAIVGPIKGHFSQVRQVSGFKNSGWVYIPLSLRNQLPSRIELQVSSN